MADQVRLHAIVIGSTGFDPTPYHAALPTLNAIFSKAGVQFLFDPRRDIEADKFQDPLKLRERAELYRGKVVVFFGEMLGGESPIGDASYIRMPKTVNPPFLAHELGHYLGLGHTFREGIGTKTGQDSKTSLTPLTSEIKREVEAYNDPETPKAPIPIEFIRKTGIAVIQRVMDGDGLTDTPPSIHEIDDSQTDAAKRPDPFIIDIPVSFVTGQKYTYQFEPDRRNVMTYAFGSSPFPLTISEQQAKIVRKTITAGNGQHLLGPALKWSGWAQVQGNGATDAAPAATVFGDRLYLFVKGNGSPKIFHNSALRGQAFGSSWPEVQGNGATDAAPAATVFGDRLYLLVKGNGQDGRIYVNSARQGNPFGPWIEVPGKGATDTAPAAAVFGERLYVFAKGHGAPGIWHTSAQLI